MCRFSILLCALPAVACIAEPAAAQARIGGGGGLGASPSRMSGAPQSGSRFGTGVAGHDISTRPPEAGTPAPLHPRGYLGSALQHAPVPSASPPPSLPAEAAQRPPATARVGAPLRPQLITVPQSGGIPPLGNSIPPLEPAGGRSRTARISGFGHRGHGGRHHFTPGLLPHFPVVFVPFASRGYGSYGGYAEHHIVVVSHETATRPQTSYQKVLAQAPEPAPPLEPNCTKSGPRSPCRPASRMRARIPLPEPQTGQTRSRGTSTRSS